MALPTDEQCAFLRDNAIPPGVLTDVSRYGETVLAGGTAGRILGAEPGQTYVAKIDEDGFLGYGAYAPEQISELPPQ